MPEDHALPRPRAVVDADRRVVGHVAEVAVDDESGVVREVVLDLTPEASEAFFGEGMRHGVLRLDAADLGAGERDALELRRNLADLRTAWTKRRDADDDEA